MRYVFEAGSKRVMHIARFTASGEMLWQGLCGRGRLNRSINAPFALGKKVCAHCSRVAMSEEAA